MTTEPEFPAAHSMDTQWFAIDENGLVAIFDTGEDGALPVDTLSLGGAGDADELATRAFELLTQDLDEEQRQDLLYAEDGRFFRYGSDDYGNPGAYARDAHVPETPADVAALPPELRAAMLRLPVDFRRDRALHLADFMADELAFTYGDTTLRGEPLAHEQPAAQRSASSAAGWIALAIAAALGLLWALL